MKRHNATYFSLELILSTTIAGMVQPAALPLLPEIIAAAFSQEAVRLDVAQTTIDTPVQFVPPTAQAAPSRGRSRGGASRGQCMAGNRPLTALVPSEDPNQPQGTAAVGLTTASHPTFWFYVPTALTPDRPAEFLLLDADGNYLHTTLLPGTATDGIIQVTLPPTVPPLEPGKTYRWTLQLLCEPGDTVDIWGEIQRVDLPLELQSQLTLGSNRDRAALYAAQGIWYDALTTLAELRRSNPNNAAIAADWQSLLQSANLPDIVNAPLLRCCDAVF